MLKTLNILYPIKTSFYSVIGEVVAIISVVVVVVVVVVGCECYINCNY